MKTFKKKLLREYIESIVKEVATNAPALYAFRGSTNGIQKVAMELDEFYDNEELINSLQPEQMQILQQITQELEQSKPTLIKIYQQLLALKKAVPKNTQ